MGDRRAVKAIAAVAVLAVAGVVALRIIDRPPPVPTFEEQVCALPPSWVERIRAGSSPDRSGDISILPKTPAYMASGAGGWSHSGPWPYLQDVPLVFYGPGLIDRGIEVDRPVTFADVAPTYAALMHGAVKGEGSRLEEVADLAAKDLLRKPPKVIVTVVWDGGGWNGLEEFPDAWPTLKKLMEEGISYTNATVGSSPSVTPSTHTTLGTGTFPRSHGITGIPIRYPDGEISDSFVNGESSRFIEDRTIGEYWDAQTDNKALVGMVGYEPWHLGMIGQGAERPGGDKDHAVWLDTETNEWITNPDYYSLPDALVETGGLEADLAATDAADGKVDGAWRDNEIIDSVDRWEEIPGFIRYHTRGMLAMMEDEGYGKDEVTDLLYTNYKQIDRVAHYFSMHADEVEDSMVASDQALGEIVGYLDDNVGKGRYLLVVTADHGMQPDEEVIDAYGINPTELERDLKDEFGPVVRGVWPTEVFLFPEEAAEHEVEVEDVARFIAAYKVEDNLTEGETAHLGQFSPDDRIFDLAVPNEVFVEGVECDGQPAGLPG